MALTSRTGLFGLDGNQLVVDGPRWLYNVWCHNKAAAAGDGEVKLRLPAHDAIPPRVLADSICWRWKNQKNGDGIDLSFHPTVVPSTFGDTPLHLLSTSQMALWQHTIHDSNRQVVKFVCDFRMECRAFVLINELKAQNVDQQVPAEYLQVLAPDYFINPNPPQRVTTAYEDQQLVEKKKKNEPATTTTLLQLEEHLLRITDPSTTRQQLGTGGHATTS